MLGKMAVWMLPVVPKKVVRAVASRYVAGETLQDAIETVRSLNAKNVLATLDILGEDSSVDEARTVVKEYLDVVEAIKHHGLRSGISLKPSHFGAREDEGIAFDGIKQVVAAAKESDIFVRLDMEDSTLTDLTFDFFFKLHKEFDNVGVVVQAYLYRSEKDLEKLAGVKANIRLCKGIYKESSDIAFKNKEDITQNYLKLAKFYIKEGGFLGIATHDRRIINEMEGFIQSEGIENNRFEFQTLLGVPIDDLMMGLVKKGYAWRVYVPFGKEWYPYSVRRLKENPEIASYVIKHMFGGKA